MNVVYIDSSAFVKLYLDENVKEQATVLEILERFERVACCSITFAEVSGVFARYFHEGKLGEEEYTEKLYLFSSDWETVEYVDLLQDLSVLASQLTKAHSGLCAMDALHLATALTLRADEPEPIHFLTFDGHLQRIAQTLMPDAF